MNIDRYSVIRSAITRKQSVIVLAVLVCCAGINLAQAEMYKWVDAQGNTHYTQSPPPDDIQYSTVAPPPKVEPGQANERIQRQKQIVDTIQKQRSAAQEEQRLVDEDKQAREQNCKLGRDRLASYERPGVMLPQPDGSRIRATEEQRQEQIKISREMIAEFCPK
jgi:hypothetical protein